MGGKFIGFYFLVFVLSCNCQQPVKKKETNSLEPAESSQISAFLSKKNIEIIESAEIVVDYKIEKTLIEGTTDEYSNKVFLRDTLLETKANELLAMLISDKSYDWGAGYESIDFDPSRQLQIRSSLGRLVLLFDEEENMLGFINLDGQKVLKLSTELSRYLKDL